MRVKQPIDIDELRAKHERRQSRPAAEREPYTRDEVQALFALSKARLKAERGTRAKRSAANKAAWAEGKRDRWKKLSLPRAILFDGARQLEVASVQSKLLSARAIARCDHLPCTDAKSLRV